MGKPEHAPPIEICPDCHSVHRRSNDQQDNTNDVNYNTGQQYWKCVSTITRHQVPLQYFPSQIENIHKQPGLCCVSNGIVELQKALNDRNHFSKSRTAENLEVDKSFSSLQEDSKVLLQKTRIWPARSELGCSNKSSWSLSPQSTIELSVVWVLKMANVPPIASHICWNGRFCTCLWLKKKEKKKQFKESLGIDILTWLQCWKTRVERGTLLSWLGT